jgi:hypothetical protein
MPRLAADLQPPPARTRPPHLCRPLRMEVKLLEGGSFARVVVGCG